MIEKEHPVSVTRQAELLAISRSAVYYRPRPVSSTELALMAEIDKIHLKWPFFGIRKIRDELVARGFSVGRERVATLMRKMGIRALSPQKKTSKPHPGHKIYPYLLRGVKVTHANHVWCTDITYLPMERGFCYLVAIMDWASRRVLSWRLSNTLDTSFCVEALEEAIARFGVPEIFNMDQGAQFTSADFISVLRAHKIAISMDGRGRWLDNVFIERLWRSVKYEEVYLKAYESISDARQNLDAYFKFYNSKRRHQGLNNKTPNEVYCATLKLQTDRSAA